VCLQVLPPRAGECVPRVRGCALRRLPGSVALWIAHSRRPVVHTPDPGEADSRAPVAADSSPVPAEGDNRDPGVEDNPDREAGHIREAHHGRNPARHSDRHRCSCRPQTTWRDSSCCPCRRPVHCSTCRGRQSARRWPLLLSSSRFLLLLGCCTDFVPFQYILTRRPNMPPSAALSALLARHPQAAVVILQPVWITQPSGVDRAAFHFIIKSLGASNRARLCVATFDKGLPLPASRALIRVLFEALRAIYLVAGLIKFSSRWIGCLSGS